MPKNIVVCCDGTTNEIAADATNVLRIFRCLRRSEEQLAYYDCGVGTIANPDRITARGRTLSRLVDSALGLSVRADAIDAYRFVATHFVSGDSIFLFGFSRGAYTVRAVAGMIHFLGLLRPELLNLLELAWSVYSGDNADHSVQQRFRGGNRFRKCFCIAESVPIRFVGVWDTVSSFGWLGDLRTLPHTANNPSINHVRHALAIDERRALFQANQFRPSVADQHESFKEVWFVGSHGDVGGGYPEHDGALSKVSLEWMLREAEFLGLAVDDAGRRHLTMNPPEHPPADPLAATHESLRGKWHIAELLPLRKYVGDAGRKRWKFPHFWRRRPMRTWRPDRDRPTIHESVERRIEAKLGYAPPNLPSEWDVEH